ncbi:apolipoprotein D-like [Pelmatolapia mariae]|uniref:apolipoprotein D-like n=1 Tax=Pelmatolapia mariae TaxID=158779 RepID=UPI002FE670B7
MSAVYLLLLLIPVISAQTFHWGPCPTPKVQSNFTLQPYLGKWYEIERLPAYFATGKCIRANYTMREDGTVRVLNSQVGDDRWSIEGTAKVIDPQEPAKLKVNFSPLLPYAPYWVLSTDYTSYTVVYSCTSVFGRMHFYFAWIFSRSSSLPPETVRNAKQVLIEEGIDISKMTPTDQKCKDN